MEVIVLGRGLSNGRVGSHNEGREGVDEMTWVIMGQGRKWGLVVGLLRAGQVFDCLSIGRSLCIGILSLMFVGESG